MGIWDYVNSTTDQLKRNSPDLTAVKHACRTTYDYSCSSVAKIDNAVRVNAVQKLKNTSNYLPDDEARSEIYRFANSFAKNAAIFTFHEGLKSVPGGSWIYSVGSRTFRDYSKSGNHKEEEIKALRAEISRLKIETGDCMKLNRQAEKFECADESESRSELHFDSNMNRKPEDVLRVFMMKGFIGRDFLDDLIVPQVKSRKNLK